LVSGRLIDQGNDADPSETADQNISLICDVVLLLHQNAARLPGF
jgi:hypothetical protein